MKGIKMAPFLLRKFRMFIIKHKFGLLKVKSLELIDNHLNDFLGRGENGCNFSDHTLIIRQGHLLKMSWK